ncbi:MAG: 4Fe-4S binding protein [Planctomycetes bacterium]|nr:4Fe-4S binding protein [Planctomycetota bacterium]
MRARSFILVALLVSACGAALGVEQRFPPPEFTETQHQLPCEQYPQPVPSTVQNMDVWVLVVALCLATWLALGLRSRNAVFALMVACLVYFGFWRQGCVCPIGAIQNVTLALADAKYAIPAAVLAFFALPLVFTLLFGRSFCAAVCPLGGIQDAVVVYPVRVPQWLEGGLRVLAYAYLGGAVIFAAVAPVFLICRYDPFVGFFRLSGSLGMLLFGGGLLAVGMFIGRPYCRFLCPYGVLLGWLSRLSGRRVTITPDACVRCRLCEDSCPFGAIRKPVEPPTPAERVAGRRRLAWLLGLVPVLAAVGFVAGGALGTPFSKLHPEVTRAERVRAEELGEVKGTTDASDAFYESGRTTDALYGEARRLRGRLALGGRLFGAWMGLVVGGMLIHLTLRRRRDDYEADRGTCIACGRCYDYCPVELRRRKDAGGETKARGG